VFQGAPARTLRLAHRGDWRLSPENSLAAMAAALAVPGCDGLEFDVRRSSDGVPVILHDETLARVQGRPERADELTAEALDAHGIPSLADLLSAAGRKAFLDVELKGEHDRAVVEVLASGRGAELRGAVISSFDLDTLERIGGLAPTWPRWLNSGPFDADVIARAVELGCRGVAVQWETIDEGGIARARAAGLDVAAWTVRRRASFDRLARLGVTAVCVEAAALDG
jgi:glycerophosphoryl diester phosphodiesterase